MYKKILRPLLFALPPDSAHRFTTHYLSKLPRWLCRSLAKQSKYHKPYSCMGIEFKNRIGCAAGFDKTGKGIDGLLSLGFGFVEIGGVTPLPQTGNPKPHMLRLKHDNSLINQCGLNNPGAAAIKQQLCSRKPYGIVGVNIAKNTQTPMQDAHKDFTSCLTELYPYANYFSINISCPNTKDKDSLQEINHIKNILHACCETRMQLAKRYQNQKPFLIKLSPDLNDDTRCEIIKLINETDINGVISCNTTSTRPITLNSKHQGFQGGLSGQAIAELTYQTLDKTKKQLASDKHIIGVGGIGTVNQAKERFALGCDLIQIYTGLIYEGPALIRKLIQESY